VNFDDQCGYLPIAIPIGGLGVGVLALALVAIASVAGGDSGAEAWQSFTRDVGRLWDFTASAVKGAWDEGVASANRTIDIIRVIAQEVFRKPTISEAEHTKGARKSTENKHERGQTRKNRDQGGEKGDARRRPRTNRPKPRGGGRSSALSHNRYANGMPRMFGCRMTSFLRMAHTRR